MYESELEDIVCSYPELIEEGLTLVGRQVQVKGKYVDLLFQDKYGYKLIVELKRGTIHRRDVAQLLDYEGYFVSKDNPLIRVMLIGTRVPKNFQNSLDHHGYEWREFTIQFLADFLNLQGDNDRLKFLETDTKDQVNLIEPTVQKELMNVKNNSEQIVEKASGVINSNEFDESKYTLESRLALLSPDLLEVFHTFHALLLSEIGSEMPKPRTHIQGVTYRATKLKAFIFVDFRRTAISMNFYTGKELVSGLSKTTWIRGGDNSGGRYRMTILTDIPLAVEYAIKSFRITLRETDID